MDKILRCKCGAYVLTSCCGKCVSPKPAKWSPSDKYGKYRAQYKKKYGES